MATKPVAQLEQKQNFPAGEDSGDSMGNSNGISESAYGALEKLGEDVAEDVADNDASYDAADAAMKQQKKSWEAEGRYNALHPQSPWGGNWFGAMGNWKPQGSSWKATPSASWKPAAPKKGAWGVGWR